MTTEGTARDRRSPDPEELLNVQQIGAEFGMSESAVWALFKEHPIPRFKLPRKRWTLFRRGDVERVLTTPVPLDRDRAGAKTGEAAARSRHAAASLAPLGDGRPTEGALA